MAVFPGLPNVRRENTWCNIYTLYNVCKGVLGSKKGTEHVLRDPLSVVHPGSACKQGPHFSHVIHTKTTYYALYIIRLFSFFLQPHTDYSAATSLTGDYIIIIQ